MATGEARSDMVAGTGPMRFRPGLADRITLTVAGVLSVACALAGITLLLSRIPLERLVLAAVRMTWEPLAFAGVGVILLLAAGVGGWALMGLELVLHFNSTGRIDNTGITWQTLFREWDIPWDDVRDVRLRRKEILQVRVKGRKRWVNCRCVFLKPAEKQALLETAKAQLRLRSSTPAGRSGTDKDSAGL